jgi:tetratricopeptide (TPR) repeat protein
MHELVRRYAYGKLEGSEADAYHGLATYYLKALQARYQQIRAGELRFALIEPESGNLQAIMDWFARSRNLEMLIEFWHAFSTLWNQYTREERYWMEQALALCNEQTPKPLRAKVLARAGRYAWGHSEYERAQSFLASALTLYTELDDASGQQHVLLLLGHTATRQGNYAVACQCYEELIATARRAGNSDSVESALISLVNAFVARCDYETAQRYLDEAYEISLRSGKDALFPPLWEYRGIIALHQKDYPHARECLQKCLDLGKQQGNMTCQLSASIALGEVALQMDHLAEARGYFRAAMTMGTVVEFLVYRTAFLEAFAHLALKDDKPHVAALILGAADKTRQRLRMPREPRENSMYMLRRAALQTALGKAAFDLSWQQGCSLSLDEALKLAAERLLQ